MRELVSLSHIMNLIKQKLLLPITVNLGKSKKIPKLFLTKGKFKGQKVKGKQIKKGKTAPTGQHQENRNKQDDF